MVLELPALQGFAGVPALDRVAKVVEERVEVVVGDDEDPGLGMLGVVFFEFRGHLEPEGRLAASLLAEDEGRRGVGRAAEELVPGGVVNRVQAAALEDRVGLRVLLAERVAGDAVVLQKLIDLHPVLPSVDSLPAFDLFSSRSRHSGQSQEARGQERFPF